MLQYHEDSNDSSSSPSSEGLLSTLCKLGLENRNNNNTSKQAHQEEEEDLLRLDRKLIGLERLQHEFFPLIANVSALEHDDYEIVFGDHEDVNLEPIFTRRGEPADEGGCVFEIM